MLGIYYFRGNKNCLDYMEYLERHFDVNTEPFIGCKKNKLYYIFRKKSKSSYGIVFDYTMKSCDVKSVKAKFVRFFGKPIIVNYNGCIF